jgi:hypothetical protein
VLTAALRRNYHSPYRLLMQHGWKYDFIDAPVIRAIEAATGLDFTRQTTEFLRQKTRQAGGIDLLDPPFFLWNPVERFYPEVMDFGDLPGRAFYRSAWPATSFALPGRPATALRLHLTLRLPRIPGWDGRREGRVSLKINGLDAGSVNAGEQWSTFQLDLRPDFLNRSINQLTLCWPPLPPCGDEAWEDAVRRLEQGMEADLHPVFGEVFSIKI